VMAGVPGAIRLRFGRPGQPRIDDRVARFARLMYVQEVYRTVMTDADSMEGR
jgi:hypothetical protein